MKKALLKTVLLPLALLFGAGAASADSHHSFADLDINGDGTLSAEEAMAVAGLDIETADTDGDGALSEAEFKAAKKSMKGDDYGAGEKGMEEQSTY